MEQNLLGIPRREQAQGASRVEEAKPVRVDLNESDLPREIDGMGRTHRQQQPKNDAEAQQALDPHRSLLVRTVQGKGDARGIKLRELREPSNG